jgi:hypothetical protein
MAAAEALPGWNTNATMLPNDENGNKKDVAIAGS